jgi:hypothetical protein
MLPHPCPHRLYKVRAVPHHMCDHLHSMQVIGSLAPAQQKSSPQHNTNSTSTSNRPVFPANSTIKFKSSDHCQILKLKAAPHGPH